MLKFPLNIALCGYLALQVTCLMAQAPEAGIAKPDLESELGDGFASSVAVFLKDHCLDCHGSQNAEGMLDLSTYRRSQDILRNFEAWQLVVERVSANEMPPKDSGYAPEESARHAFVAWSQRLRDSFAEEHAGDPGDVLARRLSAAEYNYTIRDLTGVDLQPAKQFPLDPANEAGFSNSGESLAMTPALLNKYLDAARSVSEHLLLKPEGIDFAPHPVVTDTDRDKYCVRRIVSFYEAQNTEIADYFFAVWQLLRADESSSLSLDVHREIQRLAANHNLSPKYLNSILELLQGKTHNRGPVLKLRKMFSQLPSNASAAKAGCQQLRDYVREIRSQLAFDFPHLRVQGMNRGSQTLVLWRNRQKASHRMLLNEQTLSQESEQPTGRELSEAEEATTSDSPETTYSELSLPADEVDRRATLEALRYFCRILPDAFYIDRRGREYLDENRQQSSEKEVRLLSAGFHSMMGYFRDDQPLYELLLSTEQQQTLDELWFELDFIADAPARQHAGFIWFERAEGRYLVDEEFDAFRSEDKDAGSAKMMEQLAERYLAKARRLDASNQALQAIIEHFQLSNASLRRVEDAWEVAREAHLSALGEFAERAYRRPLSSAERQECVDFYWQLVNRDGLSHQDAMRDVMVSILMSPHFCYRLQPSDAQQPIHALSPFELASRLSYFLWSSMPDEALLQAAEDGSLLQPEVLKAHASRMLRDPKVRGLALEFAGNWLGFRQFESHNSVDRERFPQFDDALRLAMYEEPVRFTLDILQNNRPVLEWLYGQHTFANAILAKHYGMEEAAWKAQPPERWLRVESADAFGRGGILPMAVFMTQNSPGLRTSPVKRGYWVVRNLLGESIPAPPPNVPELPNDEAQLGDLTLRDLLAKHREHSSCAGCHEKFDSVGLVFEGYGPIGELRQFDLAGNAVDDSAEFPDQSIRIGISGLKDYIREQRQADFVDTLCAKLLVFALNRGLLVSDDSLLRSMRENLSQAEYRMEPLIHTIITSPQFLNQRGHRFQRHQDGELSHATR
ncbi:MAG: DUF1592 domain-containing protein [bacterium]|nr:DUF1592 domain-containing protein [bacterium]